MKPLKRTRRVLLRLHDNAGITCTFKYERMHFCYIFGTIGHVDKQCELHFRLLVDQIMRK
ncbi:hypothetical protein LINGRAHAP2_LOCUS24141 [Linum grandiflorum]